MRGKNFFISVMVAIVIHFVFTNCSNSDSFFEIASNTLNNSKLEVPQMIVSDRYELPPISYHVSFQDATSFAKIFSRDKNFEIAPYIFEKDTLLYIVNYDKGWLIIAGDKRLNPVVAFAEEGKISSCTHNKGMIAWIDSYADEISTYTKYSEDGDNDYTKLWSNISSKKTCSKRTTRGPVEYKWAVVSYTYNDSYATTIVPHLISTKWGQGSPWNSKLPIHTSFNNTRCLTGCVAVSVGQIINYMHTFLGKPTDLYHNISISTSSISAPTTNIGFSRSNMVSNSTRWNYMATDSTTGNTSYAGDLMLDVGNHVNMNYSGYVSTTNNVIAGFTPYNLTCSIGNYNYQSVKTDLQNSKPINVTAYVYNNNIGHSWIIDGLVNYTQRYVTVKHFEYTENWMHESEYYDTFDEIRWRYHVNNEYDYVEEVVEPSSDDYLLMNWGYDGDGDNGYYSTYPSTAWTYNGAPFNYLKTIYYDIR